MTEKENFTKEASKLAARLQEMGIPCEQEGTNIRVCQIGGTQFLIIIVKKCFFDEKGNYVENFYASDNYDFISLAKEGYGIEKWINAGTD